jgi:iron-sulfur cluster repair protein YtfE (RIC family)
MTATTASATETGNGPIIGMLMAIHGAVRRDLARSQSAVAALVADEGARESGVQTVQEYYGRFAAMLEHHHVVEDDEVWPHLEQVFGARIAGVVGAMVAEHDDIVAAEQRATALVEKLAATSSVDELRETQDALTAFAAVVEGHLTHEEAAAVPYIAQDEDAAFWAEFTARRQQDEGPDIFLPWVLDNAPQPMVEAVTGELPPPVRSLLLEQWIPVHERLVATLPS